MTTITIKILEIIMTNNNNIVITLLLALFVKYFQLNGMTVILILV